MASLANWANWANWAIVLFLVSDITSHIHPANAMISRVKLYTQLDRLESELEEKLIPHLVRTAEGNNDLVFCVDDFNPFAKLRLKTDKETEALVNMGSKILALRKKLGESSAGSIAERICWYCHEWGDLKNPHRKSARELAQDFLKEISMNKEAGISKE